MDDKSICFVCEMKIDKIGAELNTCDGTFYLCTPCTDRARIVVKNISFLEKIDD